MWRRNFEMKKWRYRKFQDLLPVIHCIDVGASYYPHTSWWLMLGSRNVHWTAVEPNEGNLGYIQNWPWDAQPTAITSALSEHGGTHILYVTNVDSGSSLLEPFIPESMSQRLGRKGFEYFFPIRQIQISTVSLSEVVADKCDYPTFIKLDTQGSELSILRSLVNSKSKSKVLGIEIECSLLAQPLYRDSPRLWEVALYLEQFGFELVVLDVFPRRKRNKKISSANRELVNECDAIFAIRPDHMRLRDLDQRMALLAFYVTNSLFREAHILLSNDKEMRDHFDQEGIGSDSMLSHLSRSI
jgi:FkbM family methyltransferase